MTEPDENLREDRRTTAVLPVVPGRRRSSAKPVSRWTDVVRRRVASPADEFVSGWLYGGSELLLLGMVLVTEITLTVMQPEWALGLARIPAVCIGGLLVLLAPFALPVDQLRRHRVGVVAASMVAYVVVNLVGRITLQPVVAVAVGLRVSRLHDGRSRYAILGALLLISVIGVAARADIAAQMAPVAIGHVAWMGGIFFLTAYAMAFFDVGVSAARRTVAVERELRNTNSQLSRLNAELNDLALRDPLTGIANRRAFDQRVARMWERAQADEVPTAVLWLDVDAFKKYNDRYGHDAGDVVLRRIASALNAAFKRNDDLVARIGGEEFAIVLVGCTREEAQRQAQRATSEVHHLAIEHADGRVDGRVTASVGLWSGIPNPLIPFEVVARRADAALYGAKRLGGHRAVSSDAVARLLKATSDDRFTPLPVSEPSGSYAESTVIVPLAEVAAGGTPVRRMVRSGDHPTD